MTVLPDGITVRGVGHADGTPDVLRLWIACEVHAAAVQEALDGASSALDRVRSALLDGGVARTSLATGQTTLTPFYDDRKGRQSGYQATLGLAVTLRDLSTAGQILADAVAAGGDASRIHGLRLEVDDPGPLRRAARERAYADALGTAEQYAALAGRPLGAVLAVVESVGAVGAVGAPVALADVAERYAAVPVEPGTSTVSVAVDVRWELG